ncbi:hypothetical protein Scani_44250 [Streptomyces caniferus]|uniref:Uncharacterized protein n=1 Tax=Streptomyces caniferus TaxID=285557 RepID=A0A640SAK2_9ACTN|nr:hypothetical protein Scani_44250 [Streptomyces caniferus]
MRAVNSAVVKVQQLGAAQLGQQDCVQARPEAGLGPVPKAAPGRHPGAADRFGGDVAPSNTGAQHVHDPGKCRPVGNAQSPGVVEAPLRSRRQQRSHALPQVIRDEISTHPDLSEHPGDPLRDPPHGTDVLAMFQDDITHMPHLRPDEQGHPDASTGSATTAAVAARRGGPIRSIQWSS